MIRHHLLAAFLAVALAIPCAGRTQDLSPADQAQLRAMNAEQGRLSTCVAYFQVAKTCLGNQDSVVSSNLEEHAKYMFMVSHTFGAQIGMSEDAMLSRLRLEHTEMMELMKSSCLNISSLLQRHAGECGKIIKSYLPPSPP
jgi:hypothetical protein